MGRVQRTRPKVDYGWMFTVAVDATQLLDSELSTALAVSSAHARTKYDANGVPKGTVTFLLPGDVAPATSAATDRVPVS